MKYDKERHIPQCWKKSDMMADWPYAHGCSNRSNMHHSDCHSVQVASSFSVFKNQDIWPLCSNPSAKKHLLCEGGIHQCWKTIKSHVKITDWLYLLVSIVYIYIANAFRETCDTSLRYLLYIHEYSKLTKNNCRAKSYITMRQ